MTLDLARHRIVVTGGSGFLGQAVCAGLRERGCVDLHVPERGDYDLLDSQAVERLFHDLRPEIVFHLAAEVGGIGANQRAPGRFLYANLQMGINLIEASRQHGVEKFVQVGTVCAYPKFTPVPFRETDLWNGYPEETNAPYGIAKKALVKIGSSSDNVTEILSGLKAGDVIVTEGVNTISEGMKLNF